MVAFDKNTCFIRDNKRKIELERKFVGWADSLESDLARISVDSCVPDEGIEENYRSYYGQLREIARDEREYSGLFLIPGFSCPDSKRIKTCLYALIEKTIETMNRREMNYSGV